MEPNSPIASPTNTYQNPQSWQAGPNAGSVPVQTTGLTMISILFVIFGILGVLSGIVGLFSFFFEGSFSGMGGASDTVLQKLQASQATFKIPNFVFAEVNAVLSLLLLLGAVGLLTRNRWGLRLSQAACKIGILVELCRLILGVAQYGYSLICFLRMEPQNFGNEVPTEDQQVMVGLLVGLMVFGIIKAFIYAIGKMVVYYLSNRHLSKPEIAGLFS